MNLLRALIDKAYALIYSSDLRYYDEFIQILNQISQINQNDISEIKELAEMIVYFKIKDEGYDNAVIDAIVDAFIESLFDLYDKYCKTMR